MAVLPRHTRFHAPALVMSGTDLAPPKLKPQFGSCVADYVVYPFSVNGGKQHHPLPEVLLRGGGEF